MLFEKIIKEIFALHYNKKYSVADISKIQQEFTNLLSGLQNGSKQLQISKMDDAKLQQIIEEIFAEWKPFSRNITDFIYILSKINQSYGLTKQNLQSSSSLVEAKLPEHQRQVIQTLHNPQRMLKNRKILLADDDIRNVFAMCVTLEKYGLEVITAENGQRALQKLESESDIELIIMDIMMPIMDGYEAMRKIRQQQQFAGLPIIALTAKAMQEDRNMCIEAGANDYMTKPVDMEKLITMIRMWLFK